MKDMLLGSSPKTSLVGILGAIAALITFIAVPLMDGDAATAPQYMLGISAALTAAGLGRFARDNGVSSEQAGVK